MQNGDGSGIKQNEEEEGEGAGEIAKWEQNGVNGKWERMEKMQNVDGRTDQLTEKGLIKTHNKQHK